MDLVEEDEEIIEEPEQIEIECGEEKVEEDPASSLHVDNACYDWNS